MIIKTARLFCILLLFILSINGISQDNPNLDQIPYPFLPGKIIEESRESMVITIDGYDNFYLGTDFAESSITEDPNNPQRYFTVFNIDNPHYTDNGHDWQISSPAWGGYTVRGDVICCYDNQGNLYYENMYGSPTIQGCVVIKSIDNGASWSSPVTAITGIDKNWMACDQTSGPYSNFIYTTMTASNGGNFTRSINDGVSFTNTWTFDTQTLPGMMVCVGPNDEIDGGTVHVVTNSGDPFSSLYTFYSSKNGGLSFEYQSEQRFAGYVGTAVNGRHSVNNMRTRPYPFIAADNSHGPYRGRLYLVYASNFPAGNGNKPDIFLHYSDNDGATWSEAFTINDDFPSNLHSQYHPISWCDNETGRLYIHWMDTRNTPTSDSALIYATFSDDGGESFAPNVAVSNEKMPIDCITCPGGGTPRYQGDYNGVVSNGDIAMLSWADFRYGDFASFTAYYPDFAMKLSPELDTISGAAIFTIEIPGVKAYDNDVICEATVESPPSGYFTVLYPYGNVISILPGTLEIFITASIDVPPGDYIATFTARGPNNTPVHKRYATVRVLDPYKPVADFTSDYTEFCEGQPIHFYDLSSGTPTSWEWYFFGAYPPTSTQQNPEGIVYTAPGEYDISLIVANSAGSDDTTKADYVRVSIIPIQPQTWDEETCLGGPQPYLLAGGENIRWYDDPFLIHLIHYGDTLYVNESLPGIYTYYATQTINGCESNGEEAHLTIHPIPEVTLAPFDTVCKGDTPFLLTGGFPEGGNYYGTGITNNYFDPFVAGPGTHQIRYLYADSNGCVNSAIQALTVKPGPAVSLQPFSAICENEEALELTGGEPTGGVYEGTGVQDGWFFPALAGPGIHRIRYTIEDSTGCANAAEETIEVYPLPIVFIQPYETVCSNFPPFLLTQG
ncbi:MAG: PKD domain-containing protein, partial [Bacteroidetes bacterium]|nr:PKD domain-containing protein [Bacteroidota bacterium]